MLIAALFAFLAGFFILIGWKRQDRVVLVPASGTVRAGVASDVMMVQIQDRRGRPRQVKRDAVIDLSSSSVEGRFDIDPTGAFDGSTTNVTIPEGSTRAEIHYKDTLAGHHRVTGRLRKGTGRARPGHVTLSVQSPDIEME